MPKSLLKIIGYILIIFTISEATKSKDQQFDFALAKRSLLEREKEFFKNQPMSGDLRAFIERYKRKGEERREKRSQQVDDNLYVIENGQLVPLRNIKGYKRSEEDHKSDAGSFTVVPLVIPLMPKQEKLVKIRTLSEDTQNQRAKAEAPVEPEAAAAPEAQSAPESVAAPAAAPAPAVALAPAPPAAPSPSQLLTAELTTESNSETSLEEEENSSNNTKEETQVLHKILQDVEGLMQWKHEGNKKEGVICNVNGSWISEAAGMRFDICYKNSTRKKFRIHVADRIPPNEDGFLCDGNWTVFGELPFLHSGVVIALAVHEKDKHLATFIGECRVCEGSETVAGTWLIGRSSRDCKDQKASHKILSDVWRREQGHSLRKKHLQQLGYNAKNYD